MILQYILIHVPHIIQRHYKKIENKTDQLTTNVTCNSVNLTEVQKLRRVVQNFVLEHSEHRTLEIILCIEDLSHDY